MSAIISEPFRIRSAMDFIDGVQNPSNRYYVGVGRATPWGLLPEDPIGADDTAPPYPTSATLDINLAWVDMLGAKRIGSDRVSLSIPRYDWESGVVYDRYDAKDEGLYRKKFFVLTDDYNVYKCIDNNGGGTTTSKPSGTGNNIITTADGYKWKYMYTLAIADVDRFLTAQHMPIRLPLGYTEPTVGGTIDSVTILDGGVGYTSATVSIIGDGVGATATATVAGGSIVAINITNPGSNYNYATIEISGDGSLFRGYPNISPRGGHGWNPVEELGGFYVTINARMEYDEGGLLTTDNDYRKVSILRNPMAQDGNPFLGQFARQTTLIQTSALAGSFQMDEYVEGSVSGTVAKVVDFNAQNGMLYLNRVEGSFSVGETITGHSSTQSQTVSTITLPDLRPYSGKIDYLEYRRPINRSPDQIEELRITIEW